MSKTKLITDLPPSIKSFQLDVIGKFTKRRFLGEFTCDIPRIKEQCLIEKHEAYLNGELAHMLPPGVRKMHKMIAYLRFTLTDYPKFWREADLGYELRDLNVVEAVYDEVLNNEEAWIKKLWDDGEESKADEPSSAG